MPKVLLASNKRIRDGYFRRKNSRVSRPSPHGIGLSARVAVFTRPITTLKLLPV